MLLNEIIFMIFLFYIKSENNITTRDKFFNVNISINEINNNIIYNKSINNENDSDKSINKKLGQINNKSLIDDLDINEIDYAEHIVIINKHEDKLVEKIFYFLSFVLVIYIILFLYKFYKCFCENTNKDFNEENGMKYPQNDPELKRISSTDDENIFDNNKIIKDEE